MRLFGRDGAVDGTSRVTDGLARGSLGTIFGDQVQQLTKRKNTASDVEGGMPSGVGYPPGAEAVTAQLSHHLESDVKDNWVRKWGLAVGVWTVLCIRSLCATASVLEPMRYQLIFLYYQPLLLMVIMCWLWGIVLKVWSTMNITPSPLVVFDLPDVTAHLTPSQMFQTSTILSLLLLTNISTFTYASAAQLDGLASMMPGLAYLCPVLMLFCPLNILFKRARYFFLGTMYRCMFPFQRILFADFFLADICTSLAKAISDSERALCSMWNGPVLEAMRVSGGICGSASWHIPFWLAWPYVCRLLQCLHQYRTTGDKVALANALKYSTAFPVIVLSAMKYHIPTEEWYMYYKPLWLMFSLVNSAYSFYWDVALDWDFAFLSNDKSPSINGRNRGLRAELLYAPDGKPGVLLYWWVIISNFLLRIAWTYKLSSHLRHHQLTSLLVSVCEVFRRFQWIFLRVERQYLAYVKTHKLSITYGQL